MAGDQIYQTNRQNWERQGVFSGCGVFECDFLHRCCCTFCKRNHICIGLACQWVGKGGVLGEYVKDKRAEGSKNPAFNTMHTHPSGIVPPTIDLTGMLMTLKFSLLIFPNYVNLLNLYYSLDVSIVLIDLQASLCITIKGIM